MEGSVRVGGFVVIFGLLLFGVYALLGRSFLEPKVDTYYVLIADAGGIPEGSKVLLAGVKIGTVSKIELSDSPNAKMTLQIKQGTGIPAGSKVELPSSLIGLGDTPVRIAPPKVTQAGIVEPGSTLQGYKLTPLQGFLPDGADSLVPNSGAAVAELTATLKATRKLMEDQGLKSDIQKLMQTSTATLSKFGALSDQSTALMAENRAQIKLAVRSAALAMADVQTSTQILGKMLKEGKFQKESLEMLQTLNRTASNAEKLVTDIDKFVTDPKLRTPLNDSLANVADMTKTGTQIAKNTEEITKNGAVISAKAIQLTDKANQIADDAHELVKKLGGVFGKPGGSKTPPLSLSMDVIRETRDRRWRTDLEGRLPLGDSTYSLGLYDAFESNKITAQIAKPFSPKGDYRYGVYASKPGLGVDYQFTPKFGLRGDVFDLNDPRLNLRLSYQIRDGVLGWIGADSILHRNVATIGVGIKK